MKGLNMTYQIISDGACDLTPDFASRHNVEIVPFYVSFDKENYFKEGSEIDHDLFYKKMDSEHAIPSSSLPSVNDYYEVFLKYAKANTPVICICITTKFSGSYNSASTARDQITEDYPDAKITVIDSTLNTVTEGLYVYEAIRMRDNNLSYEETVANLERIKSTGRIFFTVGSLEYLVKNGRIGKVATIAGDKLGLKPIIIMADGEIGLGGVTRNREKTKKAIIEQVKKYFKTNNLSFNDYTFTIGTGYDYDEAAKYKEQFEAALEVKFSDIEAVIGTTVGCHTGPHPIGIGFIQKYDA